MGQTPDFVVGAQVPAIPPDRMQDYLMAQAVHDPATNAAAAAAAATEAGLKAAMLASPTTGQSNSQYPVLANPAAPGLRPQSAGYGAGLPWALPHLPASSTNGASPVPSGNSQSSAGPLPAPVAMAKGQALQGTALCPLVLTPTAYHYRSP